MLPNNIASLVRTIVYMVLINAPLMIASMNIPVQRTIFSFDIFVAALVALYNRSVAIIIGVAVIVGYALIYSAQVYRFKSVSDFFVSFQFASLVSLQNVIDWKVVFFVAALICMCLLLWGIKSFRINGKYLFLMIVALIFFDGINGSLSLGEAADSPTVSGVNVIGSAAYNLYSTIKNAHHDAMLSPISPEPASYRKLSEWVAKRNDNGIMVILVESLGQPLDTTLSKSIEDQLNIPEVTKRWTITRLSDVSHGTTTDGELRVLCGIKGHYSQLNYLVASSHCVTKRVAKAVGYHGFTSLMFQRSDWWPKIGLQWGNIPSDARKGCNAGFRGFCDSAVISAAASSIQSKADISYVLTLDTHLPVILSSSIESKDVLCIRQVYSKLACQHIANMRKVFAEISIALKTFPNGSEPRVLIVGDHPPPFADLQARNVFDSKRVPVFVLNPKK